MKILIFLIIPLGLLIINIKQRKHHPTNKLLKRFKNRFKSHPKFKERFRESFSHSLMLDPENNINLGEWDSDEDLKEKVDIHRSRLKKFGCSRINGEMLYMGPKGGVYKLSDTNRKIYV